MVCGHHGCGHHGIGREQHNDGLSHNESQEAMKTKIITTDAVDVSAFSNSITATSDCFQSASEDDQSSDFHTDTNNTNTCHPY